MSIDNLSLNNLSDVEIFSGDLTNIGKNIIFEKIFFF